MKLITIALLALLGCCLQAQAQVTVIPAGTPEEPKEQVIDHVQYRVTYHTEFVEDTTKHDSTGAYRYLDDDMRLDIGQNVSKFYSGRTAVNLKWMQEQLTKTGGIDLRRNHPPHVSMQSVTYRNYPSGQTSYLDKAGFDHYRMSEKTQVPVWTITADTLTLLGYPRQKAETDFKGRHWTAWFTVDIPLDYGPWKLIGLPGPILKAADSTQQYRFTAVGLEQPGGKEPITLVEGYKKYEVMTTSPAAAVEQRTASQ